MPLSIKYIAQHAQAASQDLQALLADLKESPEQAIVTKLEDLIGALSQFRDQKFDDVKARGLSTAQQQIATISEKLRPLLQEKLKVAEQEEKSHRAPEVKRVRPAPPKKSDLFYNALIALAKIHTLNTDEEGELSCLFTGEPIRESLYTCSGHVFELGAAARNRERRPNNPFISQPYHPRELRKIREKAQALGLAVLTPEQAAKQSIKDLRVICANQTVLGLIRTNILCYWDLYELYIEACKTQDTDAAVTAVIQNIETESSQAKKPANRFITFIFSDLKGLGLLCILAGIILLALFMNAGLLYIISGSALIFLGFVLAGKGLWEDLEKATNTISNALFDLPTINETLENSALYRRIVSTCRDTPPRIYPPVHSDDDPEIDPATQEEESESIDLYRDPVSAESFAPPHAAQVPVLRETAEERHAKLSQGRERLSERTTSTPS